jgi:hypothetical protein
MFFITCSLWIGLVLAIYYFWKKCASQKRKDNAKATLLLTEVFGKSHEVSFFLPIAEKNNRQNNIDNVDNNGYEGELEIEDFEVEYEYDDDVWQDFPTFPSSVFVEDDKDDAAAGGLLFDDIRRAVRVVESLEASMLNEETAEQVESVGQVRHVFKMLDETELLQKMRSVTPEMNARMEALMDT